MTLRSAVINFASQEKVVEAQRHPDLAWICPLHVFMKDSNAKPEEAITKYSNFGLYVLLNLTIS